MYLGKRIVNGLVVGGWILSAFSGSAVAQINSDATSSGTSSFRSSWEQRVLGGTAMRHSDEARSTGSQRGRWRSVTRSQADPWSDSTLVRAAADEPVGATAKADAAVPEAPDAGYRTQLDPVPMDPVSMDPVSMDDVPMDDGSAVVDDFMYPGPPGYPPYGYPGRFGGYNPYLLGGWWLRNFSFFGGVQGFKGPVDNAENGNFGFHEGIAYGGPVGGPWGVGFQAGFQVVHSDFYGTNDATDFGPGDNRNQFFFTAGLFRRALEGGVQWGVAVDTMRDQYYGQADLCQIRTEISFVRPCRGEIGYWGAYGPKGDEMTGLPDPGQLQTWQLDPINQHLFFIRRYFSGGGEGRLWAGFSGGGDGLIGGDLRLPLGTHWALENQFNFLLPRERRGLPGMQKEAWAVRMQLVWYPRRSSRSIRNNRFHPLLNVADNAVFMVDRQ